jgi:alkylation response protein AidB-like acyl-CoA dehydrogenase
MAVTNMVAEIICSLRQPAAAADLRDAKLCSGEAVAGHLRCRSRSRGSDAASLQHCGREGSGGYRLTGNKQWITSGDRAGVIVVWARTDGGKALPRSNAAAGLSRVFSAQGGTPGLTAGRPEHKLGLKWLDDGAADPRRLLESLSRRGSRESRRWLQDCNDGAGWRAHRYCLVKQSVSGEPRC